MTKTLPTAGVLPQAQPEKQQSIVMLFVGLLVTMLMSALGQTVLSTALPTIVGELNGADHMAWVVTAFILASTVVMPIYGRISDIFGRKTILLVAIALFMVGSVIGGLAQDMEWLIIARVIQGLGGGGLMILSQAAMADVIPARERGKYMGIFGAVFAVCSVAGPLVGGWLTDGPGWRWAFWMNIPLAVLAIVAVLLFLHPHKREREIPRIDYLGLALIAAATTAVGVAPPTTGTRPRSLASLLAPWWRSLRSPSSSARPRALFFRGTCLRTATSCSPPVQAWRSASRCSAPSATCQPTFRWSPG